MRIRHGGLSIDVPDDWSDQSTLLFVSAPRSTSTAGSAPGREASRESVAIRFLLGEGKDPRAILSRQLEELSTTYPGVTVVNEGRFVCGLGEGWSKTLSVPMGAIVIRQIVVCCVMGRVAIVASASMGDESRHDAEPRLRRLLESMAAI
jgi:hypothetical protein